MASDRSSRFPFPAGGSVRARTTAAAVLVVGIALVSAAAALVTILQRSMENNLRTAARLRAADFVALLESGTEPDELNIRIEEDVLVQISDGDGRVQASSPTLEGTRPITRLGPGDSHIVSDIPDEDDDAFLVVAQLANTSSGDRIVLVGRNLDDVRETTQTATAILIILVPLLLTVVGVTTWVIVGRALAPVESMRRTVDEISAVDLHRRVPDPPGKDEIARLARTMNDMLARLDEAQSKQRRLVSDASHELRNPVAAIRQHAETALAHPHDTTVPTLADEVLKEDLRLQRLTEDLLLLARADERDMGTILEPVDVDDLVLEEARRLKQTTTLRIDTKGVSAARALGDRRQLQRVLRNLSDNALRHASSVIALAVQQSDGRVVLHVDDDGPGIPTEQRMAVFERFTRLDEGRDRDRGGAGLGLAIVAEIAAAHGGTVSVEDAPTGGARFEVVLPASSG